MDATNTCLKPNNDVEIWQVVAGKITEVKIQNTVFIVKPNTNIDPVKAAQDFLNAFDTKKTAMMKKVTAPYQNKVPVLKNDVDKPKYAKFPDMGEPLARVKHTSIYKTIIVDFFRKFPKEFSAKNFTQYLIDKYGVSKGTAINYQFSYVTYMQDQKMIEQIGKEGKAFKYRFITAPFGAVPPVQAEPIDPEEIRRRIQMEREARRDQ
jgi:hypothetical protein